MSPDHLGILLLLLVTAPCCFATLPKEGFRLLDLEDVQYLIRPRVDGAFAGGLVLVHSAPTHFELRQALRQTWAGVDGYKTVFLLGRHLDSEVQSMIKKEAAKKKDIVQAFFLDDYRNLTYKHLLGYRYAADFLPNAAFVLKSDDDFAVDTFHLENYLDTFVPEKKGGGAFLLCDAVETNKPIRDPTSKWYVTESEYPAQTYPLFCSGGAYVTSTAAISLVLSRAEQERRGFWIDDVYVTGMLRPEGVPVYDWSKASMRTHEDYTEAVLTGDYFSPELMVVPNLELAQVKLLFKKFREANEKGWAVTALYGNPKVVELFRPRLVQEEGDGTQDDAQSKSNVRREL